MALLELVPGVAKNQGCPVDPANTTGCMGPQGTYWTVFGTETQFLETHAVGAVLTGLLLLGALHRLDSQGIVDIPVTVQAGFGLLAIPIAFLLYALAFPVNIVY